MSFKRLNITLEEGLLAETDQFAANERYTRSGLIAAAVRAFITPHDAGLQSAGGVAETCAVYAPSRSARNVLDVSRVGPLVRAYFEGTGGIDAAWLFGSVARGEAGPLSDVDVAILPSSGTEGEAVERLRLEAMSRLPEILGVTRVDVVSLPEAGAELGHRIVTEGVVVFGRGRKVVAEAELRAVNRYMDFVPVARLMDERLAERLGLKP